MIILRNFYSDILRILRGHFQFDRRRIQYLCIYQMYTEIGSIFWFNFMIAQRDVTKRNGATGISEDKRLTDIMFPNCIPFHLFIR